MKLTFSKYILFILLFYIIFMPYFASSNDVIFSQHGTISDKLYKNKEFLSLNRKLIDCEVKRENIFKHEVIKEIPITSYHNILGLEDDFCNYESKYPCGMNSCHAKCKLSQNTLNAISSRFNKHIIYSVKPKLDHKDILYATNIDAKIFEAFEKECNISSN